jgi:hypothetical protein
MYKTKRGNKKKLFCCFEEHPALVGFRRNEGEPKFFGSGQRA